MYRISKDNLTVLGNREEDIKAKFELPSYSLSSQKYGDSNGHESAFSPDNMSRG